jgi:hypothetical protein
MRKTTFLFSVLVLLAGYLFAFSSPALADDDPPGRVARLNYIQGTISFQPGGETNWVQANPNRPLTTGDNLWADRNSRGELHIGSSSIRVGSETGITFLNLDDRTVQIQLAQGSMNFRVRRLEGGEAFEVDTPNLAFTLERAGEYRFDVDPNGNTTSIAVREGEGDATGGGSEYHMDSGDRASFSGTDSLTYDSGRVGGLDEFDSWCRSRDDREERSQSSRYVSRDVIGYDDLDDNGEWRSVPDYGYVWYPTRVAVGWAPYRFGHWVWVAPWGWTWVEDEPWGFAPFHYGRWAEVGGGWCWVPGPVVVRPVYAPALVVFVGGARFGASLSFGVGGGVAWFPLGPREVYVPPYRTSVRYVQNVNVTNTTVNVVNVTNVYNNVNVKNVTYMHQNNVNAVTAVSHDTFVNARPVAAAAVRVNAQQIQGAEVQRNFQVAPVQKSVVGAGAVATAKPPAAVMQRQVVVKVAPAPPRASFNSSIPTQPGKAFRPAVAPGQQPQQQKVQPRQQQSIQQQQVPPQQHSVQQQQTPQQAVQQQPQSRQQQSIQQQQVPPQQHSVQQQQTPQQAVQQQPRVQQQQPDQPKFQRPPQQQPQVQQQQTRPQVNQPNNPPVQQNPAVRFAPPPKATEETYHPHQFERPPAAEPPRTAAPPPAPREEAKPQERAPEPKKPAEEKQKK